MGEGEAGAGAGVRVQTLWGCDARCGVIDTRCDVCPLDRVIFLPPPSAQPHPTERVTFDEAIAASDRPQSVVGDRGGRYSSRRRSARAARSDARLHIIGNATSTTLNKSVEFEGTTVTPRTSVAGPLDIRYPLYAPVMWARRVEAPTASNVPELSAAETRRQTAAATADAYLAIIARRRVIDANVRARDAAQAHVDSRRTGAAGQRQPAEPAPRRRRKSSIDDGLIETARLLAVSRAGGAGRAARRRRPGRHR